MCIPTKKTPVSEIQAGFLEIMPRIETHAAIYFRDVRSREKREDMIAETVGVAFRWYVRLIHRGKDPHEFPSALATYAARAVRCGLRVAGRDRAKDVLSPMARQIHGFRLETLTAETGQDCKSGPSRRATGTYEERLADNRQTPVPDQVCFRCDFPCWLCSRTARDRRIIADMTRDETTSVLARKHGISPGRVSQLRQEYHDDWTRYCGDLERESPSTTQATDKHAA